MIAVIIYGCISALFLYSSVVSLTEMPLEEQPSKRNGIIAMICFSFFWPLMILWGIHIIRKEELERE